MATLTIGFTPHVFTDSENQYIDRFTTLVANIIHYFERQPAKERRYLHLLWEIADNQPEAAMADRLLRILADLCPWIAA